MRYGTSVIGGVILLFTSGIAVYTYITAASLSGVQAAAFEFSFLYLGLTALCSLGVVVTGLAEARSPQPETVMPGSRFFLFLLLCIAYLLALTFAGAYLPVTVIGLAASMLLLGIRPLPALAVSTGFTALVYGVFVTFLNVPLP